MSKHQYSILIDVVISKLPGLKVNDSEFELGILHTGHIRMPVIAIQAILNAYISLVSFWHRNMLIFGA